MYADPRISQKVVITIMDGLVALYAGAPFGDANYAIHFGTIYASKDPVAIDEVACKQLDKWRVDAKMDPVSKRRSTSRRLAPCNWAMQNSGASKFET